MAAMSELYRAGGNELYIGAGGREHDWMADLYLKKLEAERKTLWATCTSRACPRNPPSGSASRSSTGRLPSIRARRRGEMGNAVGELRQ